MRNRICLITGFSTVVWDEGEVELILLMEVFVTAQTLKWLGVQEKASLLAVQSTVGPDRRD